MVNLQVAEPEIAAATAAPPFLLAVKLVLPHAIRQQFSDIRLHKDVVPGSHQPVAEQVTYGLLESEIDRPHSLARHVDTDPLPGKAVGSYARSSASAERIEHYIAVVAAGSHDADQKVQGLLWG